jgi:hypothetical protein
VVLPVPPLPLAMAIRIVSDLGELEHTLRTSADAISATAAALDVDDDRPAQ